MKNTIKRKIAAWGLATIVTVGGFQYLKNSYSVQDYVINPVILEQENTMDLYRCDQGFLRDVTDGPHSWRVSVKKNKFEIIRDIKDLPEIFRGLRNYSNRPYLVLEKSKLPDFFYNYKATLHLRKNDKIPKYEARGIIGQHEMYEYGTERCPEWQWKDQK
jgi:hypothetical protein